MGVGRGVSLFALNYHKVDPETSREVFIEAYEILINGLTSDRLNHEGEYFSYENVPMELKSLQQPHPPMRYGSSNETGAAWAGQNGLNFAILGAVERAKQCIDAFKAALAERGAPAIPNPGFPGGVVIAVNRHIVIAETDAEALEVARPAHAHWHARLTKLEWENVDGPRFTHAIIADIDQAMEYGPLIVGSAATVRGNIEAQIKELGVNYMIFGMYFGAMAQEDAMRTQRLFKDGVMPALKDL